MDLSAYPKIMNSYNKGLKYLNESDYGLVLSKLADEELIYFLIGDLVTALMENNIIEYANSGGSSNFIEEICSNLEVMKINENNDKLEEFLNDFKSLYAIVLNYEESIYSHDSKAHWGISIGESELKDFQQTFKTKISGFLNLIENTDLTKENTMDVEQVNQLVCKKVLNWKSIKRTDDMKLAEAWQSEDGIIEKNVFSPATDIKDAWIIAEKFQNHFHLIGLEDGQWKCDIWDNENEDWKFSATEKTAPLAICMASLKANSSNN